MTHRIALAAAWILALLCLHCTEAKTRKSTAQERQDRALRDPFGYKPDWEGTGVSGGGTAELDKEGLRKDLKNVLDP